MGTLHITDKPGRKLRVLRASYAIRTVQELLDHADVFTTTMIHTHVPNQPGLPMVSVANC